MATRVRAGANPAEALALAAALVAGAGEPRLDIGVGADVARQHQWCGLEALRQLADVFFEPALIGEREARAATR